MYNIPIFDSLTHPTIDSNWVFPKYSGLANINQLIAQMDANNITRALAVGMKGIGGYDESEYIKLLSPHFERLIPIAYFDLNDKITSEKDISKSLSLIKSLGYAGIKLHPRFSGFNLKNPLLVSVIKHANEIQLNVLICTYFYENGRNSNQNNIEQLANLLYELKGAKVILIHGGVVRLLETIEVARTYKNVLLDLSFTLCKYKGSSLDMDIQFAFNTFDQRICVGSDFPEFSMNDLRERFDVFSKDLSKEKAENIAFMNISNFLKY